MAAAGITAMTAHGNSLWTAHGQGDVMEWNLSGGYPTRRYAGPDSGAAAAAGLEGGLLPASSLWVRALAIHGRSLVGGTGWGAATPYAGEGGDAAVLLWDMDREASAGTAVPQTRAAPQAGDVWALVSKGGRVWAAVGRDVLLWE